MEIKSNISVVIQRIKALKNGYELALKAAIAPERWFNELRAEAEKALMIEAGADAAWAVPKFLALMGSAFFGGRSQWWMSGPPSNPSEALAGAVETAQRLTPTAGARMTLDATQLDLLDKVTVEQAMQLIKEWIEEGGKRLTEEDQQLMQRQGQYDNLLVERIWHIFGIHPGDIGRFEVSPGQEEAIQKLTPHIMDFFSGRAGGPQGLPAETVDVWLRRVLAAWTAHMSAALPGVIQEEIRMQNSGSRI